ncbi:MAG TPA: tetratricopeptide repeat protein [Bryobacteraceae bacterium]|nr:tetratricopeptide repeat protein [Bryobacteraceae bacterium]
MYKPRDCELELQQIDKHLSQLEDSVRGKHVDPEKATKFVFRLYHRASITGSFAEFERAESVIDSLIATFGPKEDLCLLKANLDFKFHRVANAKRDLAMAPALPGRSEGKALLADILFQEGCYKEAAKAYEDLIAENRTWDNLARLAYFRSKMGDVPSAEQLYLEAEDELTAKEMRSYAWLQLQRGVLDLTHGRYEDAWAHYTRADQAYSGFWQVEEHMAELLAAQGEFDQAIAFYERVLARVPRPDFQQTLGELYAFMGEAAKAEPWFDKALQGYLESVNAGHVHYYHHLTDFYTDVRPDAAEAVKWASKDIELRNNFGTQSGLAFALYSAGDVSGAIHFIDQALSSGVQESGLFALAARIYRAAGRIPEGEKFLSKAAAINPHYENFHVHR